MLMSSAFCLVSCLQLEKGASVVTLTLPMEVRIEEEQAGGVSVHAGALLFGAKHSVSRCQFIL
eukprot:COSAG06_NODE_5763_length_3286_cov_3.419517_2_plen_63_part_00